MDKKLVASDLERVVDLRRLGELSLVVSIGVPHRLDVGLAGSLATNKAELKRDGVFCTL